MLVYMCGLCVCMHDCVCTNVYKYASGATTTMELNNDQI